MEFAPGLGATARLTLLQRPASYTAIERDPMAAATVRKLLTAPAQRCLSGSAEDTGLACGCASVVYGEAMLTMQSVAQKTAIAKEAFRVLRSGGRYGIHEIALVPDDLDAAIKREHISKMRSVFRRYEKHLNAILLIAEKP